jgi:hypothetical protein
MATIKHRRFNKHSFLDKFLGCEPILYDFFAPFADQLPGFPAEISIESIKTYLESPPTDCEAYEQLYEGLQMAYDLSDPRGHEALVDAIEITGVNPDPDHQLHAEVLALKCLIHHKETFQVAIDILRFEKAEKFAIFKGKEPKALAPLTAELELAFADELRALFRSIKGDTRVRVRIFKDGDVTNFVVYHEVRPKAELIFESNASGVNGSISPLIYRPARQDFISYMPNLGRIEIDAANEKDVTAMRRALGKVCLEDEEFFEGEGANRVHNLGILKSPDFSFTLNDGDQASLTFLDVSHGASAKPRITYRDYDVFSVLRDYSHLERFREGNIHEAKIKVTLAGESRGRTVRLYGTNKISFNRTRNVEAIYYYLEQWGLYS